MPEMTHLRALCDEATSRFVGRGTVVGAAVGGADELTIFLACDDKKQKEAIRSWAEARSVSVEFVVSGRFEFHAAT